MYVCVYKIFWKGFISLDAIKEIHVCVCVCVCKIFWKGFISLDAIKEIYLCVCMHMCMRMHTCSVMSESL